jgi:hypothetical protein
MILHISCFSMSDTMGTFTPSSSPQFYSDWQSILSLSLVHCITCFRVCLWFVLLYLHMVSVLLSAILRLDGGTGDMGWCEEERSPVAVCHLLQC